MYEHSYHIDYGAKAAAYVDAFMENIAYPGATSGGEIYRRAAQPRVGDQPFADRRDVRRGYDGRAARDVRRFLTTAS